MLGAFTVKVEIVGTCNLTCPSCPVGNTVLPRATGSVGGTMKVARFAALLDWIGAQIRPHHDDIFIALYSWGEPLIHPQVGELIRMAKEAGYRCGLSSNLNHVPHLRAAMMAGPSEFVISLSGFHPATYDIGHRGGDIMRVRRNMQTLADLSVELRSDTDIYVHYISYRHNTGEDLLEMAAYCDRLGFRFLPGIAYFLPVEKMLVAAEGQVGKADQAIVDQLLVPLADQLEIVGSAADNAETCSLITTGIDIDVDGAVKQCCGVYDRRHNVAPQFADADFATIQRDRVNAAICGPCQTAGVNRLFTQKDSSRISERADVTLASIGSQHRFATTGKVAVARTEMDRLDAMLRRMNDNALDEAWILRGDLHAKVADKYRMAAPFGDAIVGRLAEGRTRRGRDVPWDPARLLFADAVMLRNLHADPASSHRLLCQIDQILDALADDRAYADDIADMQPIITAWIALPLT